MTYGRGHLRLNHDYFDRVVTLLSDLEQLLYIHILRYREGKSDHTILLNFPLLEARTHVSVRTLHKVVNALEGRGLVERYGHSFGRSGPQGFRFRIFMPAGLVSAGGSEVAAGPEAASDSNRVKEKIKRKTEKDAANCPDCFGTGMYYPGGYEKGVAKCSHDRLAAE